MPILNDLLQQSGLRLFGHFIATPEDISKDFRIQQGSCLALIGNVGSEIWPFFLKAREDEQDPLDRWTERCMQKIARDVGAHPIFPFDKPWPPIQQWAMQAHNVLPSPIGLLIHPVYGLWHAYRGALIFSDIAAASQFMDLAPSKSELHHHPCNTCIDKPCLMSCPVSAFTNPGYDITSCRDFLKTSTPENCMTYSCKARLACPIGNDYHYSQEHAQFHMQAFI